MPRSDHVFSFYATIGGAAQKQKQSVPSGETWVIKAIDYSGDSGSSDMRVNWKGSIIGASAGDKFACMPIPGIQLEGPGDLEIELNKRGGAGGAGLLLGVSILLEK